jgi:hypothetical protein
MLKKIIFYNLLVISLWGCSSTESKNANHKAVDEAKALMQEGDLIMRLEDDFISRLIADLSPVEKKYSHAGIVTKIGNDLQVYNLYPALNKDSLHSGILLTPIDSFINPKKHATFALYRHTITKPEIDSFMASIRQFKNSKITFDMKFDYSTDSSLYCSEMIVKAMEKATNNKNIYKRSFVNDTQIIGVKRFFKFMNDKVDLSKYPIITLDNLYLNAWTKLLYSYKFDASLEKQK